MTTTTPYRAPPKADRQQQVVISPLRVQDVDAAWDLFVRNKARTPYGYLAERSRSAIEQIVTDPLVSNAGGDGGGDGGSDGAGASVGAWDGAKLVGYSLCAPVRAELYAQVPLVRRIYDRGEVLCAGMGTIVCRDYEGRMLMARLLAARGALIRTRGIAHSAGLIAVDNLPSLAGALRAGAGVIGVVRDAYCQNFLCYAGSFLHATSAQDTRQVALNDLDGIRAALSQGWIGKALHKDTGQAKRYLTFCPPPNSTGEAQQ